MSAYQTLDYRMSIITRPGLPKLLIVETALLPCGCGAHVGIRLDKQEPTTGTFQCSEEHRAMMDHFQLLLRESLVEPGPELLIDVLLSLLDEAERNWQGAPL